LSTQIIIELWTPTNEDAIVAAVDEESCRIYAISYVNRDYPKQNDPQCTHDNHLHPLVEHTSLFRKSSSTDAIV
jgi:hypothetical protein